MPWTNAPVRILIVDDDEDDFLITTDYIKYIDGGNFVIDWCPAYNQALQRIERCEYDIYFIDYRLGAKTGLDLLKAAIAMQCEEPIVLLTGKGNPLVDKEAMQVGAFDYLVKSELNTEKLERCIRYSLGRASSLKALRANERKYRNIFEQSKDAIFIAEESIKFKDINMAMSELLLMSHQELLQLSLYDLIEGEETIAQIGQQLKESGEVIDKEVTLLDSNHDKKICVLSMSIQSGDGHEPYIQGIIHDITKIRRAEKVTLQIEKLAAAGRLVRTLAHEVRNPLSNIQMSVEQLENVAMENDDKIFLDIIKRNSKRINGLITELLNSSRPAEMTYSSVTLQTVFDSVLQDAFDRMTLKHISASKNYPDKPCVVQGDEEKLRIAFLNIIINAIEAVNEEQGFVSVSVSDRNEHVVVEIADNGSGISPENLSRLFEPYFTSKRNGMGLGLASTLNILQAHHCMVDVKSKLSEGTTFSILFPKVVPALNGSQI